MTEIEQKALALVNADRAQRDLIPVTLLGLQATDMFPVICRAIEQHEQFKREVSDAVEDYCGYVPPDCPSHPITRFILPKPDEVSAGLALAIEDTLELVIGDDDVNNLRAALAKRGLEVREIEG